MQTSIPCQNPPARSRYRSRFLEILADYNGGLTQEQENSETNRARPERPSFATFEDEIEAWRLLARDDSGIFARVKGWQLSKTKRSKIKKQEVFIAATDLLKGFISSTTAPNLEMRYGLVESILRIGGSWDNVMDQNILIQQEQSRIDLAVSAIQSQDHALLAIQAAFLLPHHLTKILSSSYRYCSADEIRLFLDLGAKPDEAIQTKRCLHSGLVTALFSSTRSLKSMISCAATSRYSSCLLNTATACGLCQIFSNKFIYNYHGQKTLFEVFNSRLMLAFPENLPYIWNTLLVIISHELRMGAYLIHDYMLLVIQNEEISSASKADAIEALLCILFDKTPELHSLPTLEDSPDTPILGRGRAWIAGSQFCYATFRPDFEYQSVFTRESVAMALNIFQTSCEKLELPTVKMLRRYPGRLSQEVVDNTIKDNTGALQAIIFPSGSLPDCSIDALSTISNQEDRLRMLRTFIDLGMRRKSLIDELLFAVSVNHAENMRLIIDTIYPGQRSYFHRDSSDSTVEFSPLRRCVQIPSGDFQATDNLGWRTKSVPSSYNVAISALLKFKAEKCAHSPPKTDLWPLEIFECLLTSEVHYNSDIERCLELASQAEQVDIVSCVVSKCLGLDTEYLYSHFPVRLFCSSKWISVLRAHLKMKPSEKALSEALILAVERDDTNTAELLLLAGADPQHRDGQCLRLCSSKNKPRLLKSLLSGRKISHTIRASIYSSNLEVRYILFQAGAWCVDVIVEDLRLAFQSHNYETCIILLAEISKRNPCLYDPDCALYVASGRRNVSSGHAYVLGRLDRNGPFFPLVVNEVITRGDVKALALLIEHNTFGLGDREEALAAVIDAGDYGPMIEVVLEKLPAMKSVSNFKVACEYAALRAQTSNCLSLMCSLGRLDSESLKEEILLAMLMRFPFSSRRPFEADFFQGLAENGFKGDEFIQPVLRKYIGPSAEGIGVVKRLLQLVSARKATWLFDMALLAFERQSYGCFDLILENCQLDEMPRVVVENLVMGYAKVTPWPENLVIGYKRGRSCSNSVLSQRERMSWSEIPFLKWLPLILSRATKEVIQTALKEATAKLYVPSHCGIDLNSGRLCDINEELSIKVCQMLSKTADIHSKIRTTSPFMDVVRAGNRRLLDHFLNKVVSQDHIVDALKVFIDFEGLYGEDSSVEQAGTSAETLLEAVSNFNWKQQIKLGSEGRYFADRIWSHKTKNWSGAIFSVVLRFTPRSKDQVQAMWDRIYSGDWKELCDSQNRESFRAFLNWAGPDTDEVDPQAWSWAIRDGRDGALADLITTRSLQSPVSQWNEDGNSALSLAIELGRSTNAVRSLVHGGAPRDDGSLHIAALRLRKDIIRLLLVHGHDPNHFSSRHGQRSVLGELCLNGPGSGTQDILSLLQELGADPNLSSGPKDALKQPVFFAIDHGEYMLESFLGSTHKNPSNSRAQPQQWLYVRGKIRCSPISYLDKDSWDFDWPTTSGVSMAQLGGSRRRTSQERFAMIKLLQRDEIQPHLYAVEGSQPPGAVGVPPEILRAEKNRIEPSKLIGMACAVCGEETTEPADVLGFLTADCEHGWTVIICKEDLQTYLATKMEVNLGRVTDEIQCWAPDCKALLNYQTVKKYSNVQAFEAYDTTLFRQAIRDGLSFAECAKSGCAGGGWIDVKQNLTRFFCRVCHEATCLECSSLFSKHGGKDCPAGRARRNERNVKDNQASEDFIKSKYCVGICGHSVEKIAGCDHMNCIICKRHFCYRCGADYEVIWKKGLSHHKTTCQHHPRYRS